MDHRRERQQGEEGRRGPGGEGPVPYTRPWPSAGRRRRPVSARARRHLLHRRLAILPSDSLATGAQLLAAALVLALLFVLPGLAWGPVLAPGSGSIVTVGRAAGASLLVAAPACTLLAALGALSPPVVIAVLAALGVAPFLLPGRRRAAARAFRGAVRGVRSRRRATVLGITAAAALVAVVLVVLPSRAAVGDALLPFSSTVWYYANLARETALATGFPEALPEWGTLRPFQADYLPVTAHTAAAFALLPGLDLRVVLEGYRLAVLGAALATAAMLLRRFVSTWPAVLGACLLLATVRLEGKFLAYRPETWALALALFTLWLADRAMVERSRRLAVVALAGAAVTWLAHAEVFLLLGPALAGLAAGRLLVTGGRPGLRIPSRAALVRVGAVCTLVFVGGLLAGSTAAFTLTGELRVLGYVARERLEAPAPAPPPADEVPPGWTFTEDPTWDFYVAAVAPGQLGREPPVSFTDRRLLPRSILHVWPGLDARFPGLLVVLAVLLVAPWLAWPLLDARRRRALLAAAVFGVGLAAGAYLLFAISDTYVPMRTGPRRLLPYELVLPVVAALLLLVTGDRVLRPGWRALLPRRGAALAAGLAMALVTAAMIAPAPGGQPDDDPEPGLSQAGYDAYRWIDANLPAGARILANAYTDGSVAALARRTGIVDGRAVYLEDRAFLAESTALLLGARTVFLDPDGPGARRYLAREGVTHLLVAADGATGADLGGYLPFTTDLAALDRSAGYTLVRSFDGGRLRLYAVRAPAAPGG